MKQLTKEETIILCNSKVWEKWSDEEIVRFQLFQKRIAISFRRFRIALNKVLEREVYSHELTSSNIENIYKEYLGVREPPTLEEIQALIPKDKILISL